MQSWGGHTYEDLRHTEVFPTRSAVVGLLGACLGIERSDREALTELNASLSITARLDKHKHEMTRITDYHTIEGARTVKETPRKDLTPTRREYLCDACYTVALANETVAAYDLDKIAAALERPIFTPFLGRRSCPITWPLFDRLIDDAEDALGALRLVEPHSGMVYAEFATDADADKNFHGSNRLRLRDVALYRRTRQFTTRHVYFRTDPPKQNEGSTS